MLFNIFGRKSGGDTQELFIGEVIHYFSKVKAAVVKIKKETLSVGDSIKIKGHTTDLEQRIRSLQIQHQNVQSASKGTEVAIKVNGKTRTGDKVFVLRKKQE